MDTLQEVVTLAVEKMQEKRAELERLRTQHIELQIELGKLDVLEQAKLNKLRAVLRDKVICIRKLEPSFLKGVDDFLPFADQIRKRDKEIETGMGKMYLFIKTTPLQTMKTLVFDSKKIVFQMEKDREKKEYDNPFDYIYMETDDPKTPGKKNFDLYVKSLLADVEKHNDYAGIAFGPSGTGKTTMIERVVQHLLLTFKARVAVMQVYPRENIRIHANKVIPPTAGADESIQTGTGPLYESFQLCTVGPNDLTHVYLNDVEMINSIGTQMLEHGRAVYCILEGVRYLKCTSAEEGLTFDEDAFKEFIRNEEPYSALEEFDRALEMQVLTPVKAKINLYNNALLTLRTLLKKRLYVEREYFKGPRTQEQTDDFVLSGGFIPLHWFRYLDVSYSYDILFFKDLVKLQGLKSMYEAIYLEENPTLVKKEENYMFRYFRFSSKEVEDLYFPVEEPVIDGGDYRRQWERKHIQSLDDDKLQFVYLKQHVMEAPQKKKLLPYLAAVKGIAAQVKQARSKLYDPKTEPFRLSKQPYPKDTLPSTFIADVKKFSFQRSTPQNQTSSRCATFYLLEFNTPDGVAKRVRFIDLPGNEDQVMGCIAKEDDHLLCTETLGIRSLLTFVQNFMMVKRLNVEAGAIQSAFFPSTILQKLFNPLLDPNCKVGFLCFAANYAASPNYTPNTFMTLNYVSALIHSSFSCVEGENLKLAKELATKNEIQRLEYEKETSKLYSKPELEVAVKPSGTIADLKVTFKLFEKIPFLIGNNLVKRPERVLCTIHYTMTTLARRFVPQKRIVYRCQFAGTLEFQSKNAYRFVNISTAISFKATHEFDASTKELVPYIPRAERFSVSTLGLASKLLYPVKEKELYDIGLVYRYKGEIIENKNNREIKFDGYKKPVHLPFDFREGDFIVQSFVNEDYFYSFKPTFFDIDFYFYNGRESCGTIVIMAKNGTNFEVPDGEYFNIKTEPYASAAWSDPATETTIFSYFRTTKV
jgi:hypothetical protein